MYILTRNYYVRCCLKAHADQWKGDDDEKQRRPDAVRNRSYLFRSYDPVVTKLYTERYAWIGASMRVVVCTHKTAMSLELALLLKNLITTGKCVNVTMYEKIPYTRTTQKY